MVDKRLSSLIVLVAAIVFSTPCDVGAEVSCPPPNRIPCSAPPPRHESTLSAEERSILLAFYHSTDGPHWKDNSGWLGKPGTECDWVGVECGSNNGFDLFVRALVLPANNLSGRLPTQLDKLRHLDRLIIPDNHLKGSVPVSLIQRWQSGVLDLYTDPDLLTDVTEIGYAFASSSVLCDRREIIFHSDGHAVSRVELCRNRFAGDRATYCEVKEGEISKVDFIRLAKLTESLDFYHLSPMYERMVTHAAFVNTSVIRNGKAYKVTNYGTDGPSELWLLQRAIEGVGRNADWTKKEELESCTNWKLSK